MPIDAPSFSLLLIVYALFFSALAVFTIATILKLKRLRKTVAKLKTKLSQEQENEPTNPFEKDFAETSNEIDKA